MKLYFPALSIGEVKKSRQLSEEGLNLRGYKMFFGCVLTKNYNWCEPLMSNHAQT